VRLVRNPEMYAWVETKKTRTEKRLGGGSDTITTYEYSREWTSHPEDSSSFKVEERHENPQMAIASKSWSASTAQVGAFKFSPADAELPTPSELTLKPAMVTTRKARVEEDYLYQGDGTPNAPKVGDVRIKFSAVVANTGDRMTLYGTRQGSSVAAFMYKGEDRLFRVLRGTHAEAIAALHGEHVMMTWILRVLGFIFMWGGMALTFAPLNAVLDVVPFLGSTGRFVTGLVLLPIAFCLSVVTIVLSVVAHSPILLVLVVAGLLGGGFLLYKRKASRKAASSAAAA
jgi:hypothetical protein